MRRIHYAEDSIVTGDEIALAVLEYARMLAVTSTADTVEVPVLHGDGIRSVQLLLGPASQMFVEDEPSVVDEIVDTELVADLQDRADRLRSPSPVYSADDVSVPFDPVDDELL
ncbi:hypothetical protein [Rathayibacter tanaceti]|uniref:Uncharacterized protein n=2 Tax=Rathayibacter tanaceti TaxID=1671680 RepID=A0A166HC25_9MICO|nr:hypothetical protein [Rathayibacter tanaceti]KZX20332.1 hypothetical protein ACH61_02562 [Rathayibacter tanaceti]QHC55332.1 hypothetical protein GSU10_06580 [Rathayibacter tanaceti]TCO36367.1 hypothetical protein EV639_10746 [Rathayibacter tanaceti]